MENGTRFGRGLTLWFTGLSGAGKTTIAEIVGRELRERELKIEALDGDIVRTNLSKGLGFRGCADRSWSPGRSAFPTVAHPAFSDQPPHDDDHVRERHPEVDH